MMMKPYLENEKIKQIQFKAISPTFSAAARADGIYKGKTYPFCLPLDCAGENLYPDIRQNALLFFAEHDIKWHDGQKGAPSNHLCSSQVCCINFLFPLTTRPLALAALLHPVFPELHHMLPVEDGLYVSFEWIGAKNYLKEKTAAHSQRTRGANFTSADAIVMFERKDKRRQIVLIEWKYTEAYSGSFLKIAESGTDRSAIYRPLFESSDCPINKEALPGFDALFYEPFYQLMRQQLLVYEMEKYHEMDADLVSVLHISPAHNLDFRKVTSPALQGLGDSTTEVWHQLQKAEGSFISINAGPLFACFLEHVDLDMRPWRDYILARYGGVLE
jgi:hypothetical protein